MRVLIACDKFKDCMDADEACDIVAEEVRAMQPRWHVDCAPLTDGGEGFARILTKAAGGTIEPITVPGPRFEPVTALVGWVNIEEGDAVLRETMGIEECNRIAIIEMAQASGLQTLPPDRRDPWRTSTWGTGALIRHAVEAGASGILLGIGGSATNDLGSGALEALGLRFLDRDGASIEQITPARWRDVDAVSGSCGNAFPPVRIACDVDNPLLGTHGATAVFGPQKGLAPQDIPRMEAAVDRFAHLIAAHFRQPTERMQMPAAGAAGGIGFGLHAALPDVDFTPGATLVKQWLGLSRRIAAADLIITGEGRLDAGSLRGKGPGTLIENAGNRPVLFLAGSIAADLDLPERVCSRAISPEDWPLERALKAGRSLLRSAVREALDDLNSEGNKCDPNHSNP